MNPVIVQHFDAIEANLLESPAVISYKLRRREIAVADGKLRVKVALSDGGTAELYYPDLPNAPHHVHDEDGLAQAVTHVPDLLSVIEAIEKALA